MKKATFVVFAMLTLMVAVPCLMAAETETLNGEYVWKREDKDLSGPIKAVFEPTGEHTWNVSFHFSFDNEEHHYSGTANGSLEEGELSGEVMSDGDEPRPFNFKGSFTGGTFEGTHAALRDGEAHETGTLTLTR